MSSMDNFLAEQAEALQLERQRLCDGENAEGMLDGLDASHGGAGGDAVDAELSTSRSNVSVRSEKLHKDALNQALSGGEPAMEPENNNTLASARRQRIESDRQYTNDSFYSHFPSFGDQNKQREQLVNNRHQDYRDHLVKVAQKEADETKRKAQMKQDYDDDHRESIGQVHENPISGPYSNHHQLPNDSPKHHNPGSPYDHKDMLDGLKHTNTVSGSQHSAGIIKDSNEEFAQEAARRKLEYQRDLMKQIEDKKQEVKALRAREKAEEEQITKRLEEQLKSIQLEEQLRRERKRSEQARITSEQNHIYRMHLLSKLEADAKENQRSAERTTAPSGTVDKPSPQWSRFDGTHQHAIVHDDDDGDAEEFDDDAVGAFDPRRAYKYFSNSARPHNAPLVSPPRKSIQAFLEVKRTSPATDTLSSVSDYCKRCLSQMRNGLLAAPVTATKSLCIYCDRRRLNLPLNEEFCLKCSVQLATSTERQSGMCASCRHTDLRCGFCQKHIDMCPQCGAVLCLRCHRRHQLRQVDEEEAATGFVAHDLREENEENVRPVRHHHRETMTTTTPSPPAANALRQQPQQRLRRVSNTYDEDRPIITHARSFADAVKNTNSNRRTPRSNPQPQHNHRHGGIRAAAHEDSDSEHDLPAIGFLRAGDEKPFSTNVPRTSIFHPDSRIDVPKLALNMHHGQVFVDEQASKYSTSYDAFPVPLMPTTSSSSSNSKINNQKAQAAGSKRSSVPTPPKRNPETSQAVRKLQEKWEIPAVQKNVITVRPMENASTSKSSTLPHQQQRVLTQLGAIRRQLQLEQMELDDVQY